MECTSNSTAHQQLGSAREIKYKEPVRPKSDRFRCAMACTSKYIVH